MAVSGLGYGALGRHWGPSCFPQVDLENQFSALVDGAFICEHMKRLVGSPRLSQHGYVWAWLGKALAVTLAFHKWA